MHDVKTRFPVYSCLLSVVTPSYSCVLRCIIHETFACDNTPRWRTEFIRFRHPVRCFGDVSKFTEWNQHHLSSQQSQRKVRKRKDCVYYFLPIWLADYLLYEFQLIFVSMEEKKSNSIWKMEYTTSAKANYSFLRMNRKICINMRNTFFFLFEIRHPNSTSGSKKKLLPKVMPHWWFMNCQFYFIAPNYVSLQQKKMLWLRIRNAICWRRPKSLFPIVQFFFSNVFSLHNLILIMKCVNFSENNRRLRNEFNIFVHSLRAADLLLLHHFPTATSHSKIIKKKSAKMTRIATNWIKKYSNN